MFVISWKTILACLIIFIVKRETSLPKCKEMYILVQDIFQSIRNVFLRDESHEISNGLPDLSIYNGKL